MTPGFRAVAPPMSTMPTEEKSKVPEATSGDLRFVEALGVLSALAGDDAFVVRLTEVRPCYGCSLLLA